MAFADIQIQTRPVIPEAYRHLRLDKPERRNESSIGDEWQRRIAQMC
jgi:hypothetical protein